MIWPPQAAYLGDLRAPLRGRSVPDLTPRRLGYLEAIGAPCVMGGEETPAIIGAELAIITGPLWLARRVASGSEVTGWVVARLYAPRKGLLQETARRLSVWVSRQLWTPPRYEGEGERRSGWPVVTPTATRLAATAYRLGLGSPRRDVRRGAWDASVREILALSVADAEGRGDEYGTYDEHLEAQRRRKHRKGGRHGK